MALPAQPDIYYQEALSADWGPLILAFDRALASDWVCDQPAQASERDAGPTEQALEIYLRRPRSAVVLALDGSNEIVGYIIVDDDSGGRGGARGRFMGVTDPVIMQGLFDFVADRYGWVWGRITNPTIAVELPKFGCKPMENPDLYSYRRP
jgi:hypothetical protein